MISGLLKFKSWQLVLLLSNYWFLSIIIQKDLLLLDILFIVNMGSLFVWYALVIRVISNIVCLKLKFIYGFYLAVIFLFTYIIFDITPFIYHGFWGILSQYIALFIYLFIVLYVTIYFLIAEDKKGVKENNLFIFMCFFIYPVGIFFINKRMKKYLL